MNSRYQIAYAATLSGITSFPQAYQIDAREEADILNYTPGVFVEGTTLAAQNLEMWIVRGTFASQGWIPAGNIAQVLKVLPHWVQQAGIPSSVPWTGPLKAALLFQQFAGAAMVNGRLSFSVVPYNYSTRRVSTDGF